MTLVTSPAMIFVHREILSLRCRGSGLFAAGAGPLFYIYGIDQSRGKLETNIGPTQFVARLKSIRRFADSGVVFDVVRKKPRDRGHGHGAG